MTSPKRRPNRSRRPTPIPGTVLLFALCCLAAILSCSRDDAEEPVQQGEVPAGQAPNCVLLYPSAVDSEARFSTLPIYIDRLPERLQDMSAVIRRYLEGPVGADQFDPYPEGVGLRALYLLSDETLVVDLTGPVRSGGGTSTEVARVYGLVNTLCWNYTDLDGVRILVDGQEVKSLLGHLSLTAPLPPDPDLLSPLTRSRWRTREGR